MLTRVQAIRFERAVTSGKTKPSVTTCLSDAGVEVELVLKLSAACDARENDLIREAAAAMLGADLQLPVPEPYLVEVDTAFANSIPDEAIRTTALKSIGFNFGSKKLPEGFAAFPRGATLQEATIQTATEILAFDVLIQNPDRTISNPNLLQKGNEFAIFDHELSLYVDGIIGWKPPWQQGSVSQFLNQSDAQRHVFFPALRGKRIDLERFGAAFMSLPAARFTMYREALPKEWIADGTAIDNMIAYLLQAQHNFPAILNELIGALR